MHVAAVAVLPQVWPGAALEPQGPDCSAIRRWYGLVQWICKSGPVRRWSPEDLHAFAAGAALPRVWPGAALELQGLDCSALPMVWPGAALEPQGPDGACYESRPWNPVDHGETYRRPVCCLSQASCARHASSCVQVGCSAYLFRWVAGAFDAASPIMPSLNLCDVGCGDRAFLDWIVRL